MNFDRMPCPAAPGFEKEALLGAAWAGTKALAGRAFKSQPMRFLSARVNDNSLLRAAAPYGQKAENLVARGVGAIAPSQAQRAQRLVKGISKPLMREGFSGAVAGSVLGGGINAALAEPGERGKAFLSGAAQGAFYGGVGGVLQGGSQGLVKNMRAEGIRGLAQRHGMPMAQVGQGIHKMSPWQAIKGSVGAPSMERSMARQKVLGGAGAIGATFVAPNLINPSMPEQPPPPPAAPQQPGLVPNTPGAYYQKQVTASAHLRPIDFSGLPGRP